MQAQQWQLTSNQHAKMATEQGRTAGAAAAASCLALGVVNRPGPKQASPKG